MMLILFSQYEIAICLRGNPLNGPCETGIRLYYEPMGHESYREKKGGARLEEG